MILPTIIIKNAFFGSSAANAFNKPTDLVSVIIANAYVAAGVILFIFLVFGGFSVIMSSGNPESAKKGKKTITNAIIGFIVIFASYWIIQIIQVLTGIQIL